jgi:hypothetical protein
MSAITNRQQFYWTSALNLLREKDRRSWILLNPTSLGDTWVVCALAKSFKETHGGALTMVVKPAQTALAQMYQPYIDRIMCLQQDLHEVCERIQPRTTFDIDQPIIAHPFWHGDGRLDELSKLFEYKNRGGLLFVDFFRYILRLPWTSELVKPTIPDVWRNEAIAYARELGMAEGQSVILFPNNNTNKELPDAVWQTLADKLRARGVMVFTNMFGNTWKGGRSTPFEGTKAITVQLHHAIPLAEFAGRIISGPNGLCATMLGADVATDVTVLIYAPPPGAEYSINQFHKATDPIMNQSFKITGLRDWNRPAREYAICPTDDLSSVMDGVADRNPEKALQW